MEIRRNCQINLLVHVPQGYTYAIARADYRGFASLQPGASAQAIANYYFQGDSDTNSSTHSIDGPYQDNWEFSDITDGSELVWKPCGEARNFNINTELRAHLGSSDPAKISFITMSAPDGSVNTRYQFAWRACP